MSGKNSLLLDKYRRAIARNVRRLRQERRFSQAQLAAMTGLSQGRFSQIERGIGSFDAEVLLLLAQLFNVPISTFMGNADRRTASQLQNQLARLGARHLREDPSALPADDELDLNLGIREALASADPRLIVALAPVVVSNIDRVRLPALEVPMLELGLHRRVPWLAENVLAALEIDRRHPLPRTLPAAYRRTELVLTNYLQTRRGGGEPRGTDALDVLDPTVRTSRSLDQLMARASELSRRWGIASDLQPADFAAALEAARAAS